MSGLTEEQKRRMEENRRKALEKRAKAQSAPGAGQTTSTTRPVSAQQSRPVSSAPSGPASSTLTRPVSSAPARPVSSTLARPVSSAPAGPATSSLIKPVSSSSNQSTSIIRPAASSMIKPVSSNYIGNNQQTSKSGAAGNNQSSSAQSTIGSKTQGAVQNKSGFGANTGSNRNIAQANSFYSSNGGNKSQGTWNNRPNNSASSSSGQYRSQAQNQGANFNNKRGFDKKQNSKVLQKLSNPGGAPTELVNQLFADASNSSAKTKGSCALISRTRFEVNVIYHAKLIEVFKTMSTRQYNSENRRWSFHVKEYEALLNKMGDIRSEVHIEPLPRSVLQMFRKYLRSENPESEQTIIPDADLSQIDEELVETLLPFQREGVNFAVHQGGRVLIADDMGLGKTLQALCVACYYRREWPLLIVVPSSVRFQWRDQIWQWVKSVHRPDINVSVTGKDDCTKGLVNIISYDLMMRKSKDLLSKGFRVVVFDECHFLKSHTSKRTKEAMPIIRKATRAILLSGTPAMSRPKELFTQLTALDYRSFPKFQDFGVRYCDGKQMPYGWDWSGSSNMAELEILLKERIMIRRLKRDVIKQLPGKRRQMVLLDPSSVKTNKSMTSSHNQVGKAKGSDRRGMLLQYFHETATAKIPAVKQYMMDQLESGHKFLLFAHHQEILNALEAAVSKSPFSYIRIDGSTGALARNDLCNRFQTDHQVVLALLSITAANAGLNMTAASLVIFGELFWNPGILVQAEDRVHRIGQEDSVNVHYLVAQGTADDYIWPLVQRKLDVLGRAGLSKDDFSDADTKQLKDPRRKDITSYFSDATHSDVMTCFEESFFEDDDVMTSQEVSRKLGDSATGSPTKQNSKSPTKTRQGKTPKKTPVKQTSLLRYMSPTKSASPVKRKHTGEAVPNTSTSDVTERVQLRHHDDHDVKYGNGRSGDACQLDVTNYGTKCDDVTGNSAQAGDDVESDADSDITVDFSGSAAADVEWDDCDMDDDELLNNSDIHLEEPCAKKQKL